MLHSFRKSTNIFFSNDKYAINYLYIAHFIKRRDAKTRRTIFEEAKFTEFYVFFEILTTFLPPCFSIIALYSSRE